ncbi:MAG: phospholipase D-like domain-containing protein [Leptospiraceae bacterium]|nr:phospholipase D-like domain-containing protein [Leptospiraceae bacterium]
MKQKLTLILLLLFLDCRRDGSLAREEFWKGILFPKGNSSRAFFSYPGRWENSLKKRNVLEHIKKLISNTKNELYIMAYSLDNPEVVNEIKNAKNRGVKLNISLDGEKEYKLLQEAQIDYKIWDSSGLQHIKLILADNRNLFFGTGNFSEHGLTNDWNGYIEIVLEDSQVIKLKKHLEEASDEIGLVLENGEFYFSPKEGKLIQEKILTEIKNAKRKIQILSFDHTDKIFSHELKKATLRAVQVLEVGNDPVDPEIQYLNQESYGTSSKMYKDGNTDTIATGSFPEGGLLHHKTILIDDEILITGSYNFSLNARDNNREIIFFTKDRMLVQEFISEFERIKNSSYELQRDRIHFGEQNLFIREPHCNLDWKDGVIIELTNGIFQTTLSLSKSEDGCIFKKKFDSISTGFTSLDSSILDSMELWNGFKVFERNGNRVWNTEESRSYFSNTENPIAVRLDSIDFSISNQIELHFSEKLKTITEVIIFPIGRTSITARVMSQEEQRILVEANLNSLDRNRGVIFLISKNESYFTCYGKTSSSANWGIDYLFTKLNLQKGKRKWEACFSF